MQWVVAMGPFVRPGQRADWGEMLLPMQFFYCLGEKGFSVWSPYTRDDVFDRHMGHDHALKGKHVRPVPVQPEFSLTARAGQPWLKLAGLAVEKLWVEPCQAFLTSCETFRGPKIG